MQPTRNIQSYPDTAGRGQLRCAPRSAFDRLLSAGFAGIGPSPSGRAGRRRRAAGRPPPHADAIKQREQELEAARAAAKERRRSCRQKLKADIAAIGQDRSKLNQQLIDIAAQVRGVETRIGDAEARLRPLDAREQQIRSSLDSRRSEIVEVLAALQRAGRRTPPALLVRPEDALQSLRTAMLLGSVVPEMRARARKAGRRPRRTGRACARPSPPSATSSRSTATSSRTTRPGSPPWSTNGSDKQSAIEKDMEAEGARAIALSRQVDSLQGLIAKMEQDLKSAAKAAATASLQGAPATLNGKPNLGALKDPGRLSPAIAFASAKGLFALPVNGVKIREFGGSDGAGGVEKGISLATRAGRPGHNPV